MKLKVLETDRPWYAGGLKFTCTQCGNCCTGGPGYVWISVEEIQRLADFLKLDRQEVIRRYCRRLGGRYSLNEARNAQGSYDCLFLKEEQTPPRPGQITHTRRTCQIYPVRPLQCRTWPFWEGNLSSEEDWNRAAERCPGMSRGKHYPVERIVELRDAEDWPDKPPGPRRR